MELAASLGQNNEYNALHGEVVDYDVYHVRTVPDAVSINDPTYIHWKGHEGINFVPDVVLDLGANVGIFTRYARSLWPDAVIIAVEPNPSNCKVFREHTSDEKIILHEAAIGQGQMYYCHGAVNGAHECYLSQGIGYNELAFKELGKAGVTETSSVKSLMLPDIYRYIHGTPKVLLKLDIEGNETVIFNDPPSMDLMKTFEYICMELHYFASDGAVLDAVKKKTHEALHSLAETHSIRFDHVYFYARKYGTN